MDNHGNNLVRDLGLIVLSILVAVILAKTGALESLITSTQEMRFMGSFIAGILFVSVFTVAPATIALGEIAQSNSVIAVALIGGLGALIGDLLIFRFVKDKLLEDLLNLIKTSKPERLISMTKIKGLKWVMPFIYSIIIRFKFGWDLSNWAYFKSSIILRWSFRLRPRRSAKSR